jgi:acyl-CoA synthetase (AMP-forming)/AMP-acid ligase II
VSLTDILTHHADRYAERPALVGEGGTRQTWSQLLVDVQHTAGALRERGVGAGDVVGVLMYNAPRFLELMHAISHLGAIFMPLNWRLAPAEIGYIAEHSETSVLVTEPELAQRAAPAAQPRACRVVLADELRGAEPVLDAAQTRADDVHRLMYTSGTTSRPKGVMISYGNLWAKNAAHIVEFEMTAMCVNLACGPLYHVGALDLTTTTLMYLGATTHVLRRFEPAAVLAAIERERITDVWLAPAMIAALVAHPDAAARDLTSLRLIIDGGEKMPLPLIERVLATFPNAWFADGYGMTETVSGDTMLDKGRTLSKLGSVGKPVLHTEIRTVRPDGSDCDPGEPGEVIMRGPKVCKGYWRDERATAETIRDGWLHSGDLGVVDDDGYLFIVDRLKDVIVSGGENIASSEVERVLYEHPAVVEVAVVARPDERWNEVPVAFYVTAPGETVQAAQLEQHCRRSLAGYKVPKGFVAIEALPRNPSGKVLKRELRARAAADAR